MHSCGADQTNSQRVIEMRDFQIFKAVMFLCEFMPAGFVTPSWR